MAISWLGAACDNPACVFGPDGCSGTSSGSTTDVPATVPANHQWVELGAPLISAKIPATTATTLGTDSPMAIVFSESMSAASLASSLRLEETGSNGFSPPVQTASSLVSDGRVLVILPLQPLELGSTYDL
ncbi:MAG TPA: Ig-like domain-containing protein, partial [Planctomycetota bacterium]|nr:Ig-like domain-containing protein [Planctomycetota bacterium]